MTASQRIKKTLKGEPPLKLDFGCGPNKRVPQPGEDPTPWIGVDEKKFDKVDVIMHIGKDKWPWKDNSVDEAHASHFVEHLTVEERIHFVNELYRVLKPSAKCTVITPHWDSMRAYGDLTHKWPPVCEFWYFYLEAAWRLTNAPHNDFYTCNFKITWGNVLNANLHTKNEETSRFAQENYKEAISDLIATFVKIP